MLMVRRKLYVSARACSTQQAKRQSHYITRYKQKHRNMLACCTSIEMTLRNLSQTSIQTSRSYDKPSSSRVRQMLSGQSNVLAIASVTFSSQTNVAM